MAGAGFGKLGSLEVSVPGSIAPGSIAPGSIAGANSLAPPKLGGAEDDEGARPSPNADDSLTPDDDQLLDEFKEMMKDEGELEEEARRAYYEMLNTPMDSLDQRARRLAPTDQGLVGRRAPLNPLASPKLGKYRVGGGTTKVADPALSNNPLRGRLLVTLCTTGILIFVFLQCLVYNYIKYDRFIEPKSVNSMYGPRPEVLNDFGGLNTNEIRAGQTVRLFWSMWMHSGWLHIGFNVLSQLQFLYMFEPDWGFWRSFLVFWISGISGNLFSVNLDPCSVTVGSSGGLYGLMGGMIVYCIEYWKSIPRPGCILIFTLIVVAVSMLTGFTGNTDNWAHLGGLIGGFCFAMGTITSLSACESWFDYCFEKCCKSKAKDTTEKQGVFVGPDGKKRKKVVKRAKVAHMGKDIPQCKCGAPEWIARILCWIALFLVWFFGFWCLYKSYDFQPAGHVTFKGTTACCCCYYREGGQADSVKTWSCNSCVTPYQGATWGDYCDAQLPKETSEVEYNDAVVQTTFYRRLLASGGDWQQNVKIRNRMQHTEPFAFAASVAASFADDNLDQARALRGRRHSESR